MKTMQMGNGSQTRLDTRPDNVVEWCAAGWLAAMILGAVFLLLTGCDGAVRQTFFTGSQSPVAVAVNPK